MVINEIIKHSGNGKYNALTMNEPQITTYKLQLTIVDHI